MAIYNRGGCKRNCKLDHKHNAGVWWMDFRFHGQRIRETTGAHSKTLAREVAKKRRHDLEAGAAGIRRQGGPKLLPIAAADWLESKRLHWSQRTYAIEKTNLDHILPRLGKLLTCDLEPKDITRYQQQRLAEGASPKTINLELGTIRAILKRAGTWARLQPEVRMLKAGDDVGRAISAEEEARLLAACSESRSRLLRPFILLLLETGARYNTIRMLTWEQVDLAGGKLRLGQDKTAYGTGRELPLTTRARQTLEFWAMQFPGRQPAHYVFPSERAGGSGAVGSQGKRTDARFKGGCAYNTDPTRPVGDIKEAWEYARRRARVQCRLHDLRHSAASRMLAAGFPLPMLAKILGWSPATAVRMAQRYGHFTMDQMRAAMESISGAAEPGILAGYPQFSPQSQQPGSTKPV